MKAELECGMAAGFLGSGRALANCGNCAALAGAGGVLLADTVAARALFAAAVVCWPAVCYFGMRVAIDARLFEELQREPVEGGAALDEWLRERGLANAKPGRSIGERSRGALRLWRRLLAAVAIQMAAALAGVLVEAWSR